MISTRYGCPTACSQSDAAGRPLVIDEHAARAAVETTKQCPPVPVPRGGQGPEPAGVVHRDGDACTEGRRR